MSSSKSLPSSGTEPEIKRMINFKKFRLQPYAPQPENPPNVPVTHGKNSMSGLASSNYIAINGVNSRIGNTKPAANVNAVP